MVTRYDRVDAFHRDVLGWSSPRVIPELALYAQMADLFLEAVDSSSELPEGDSDEKSAIVMLLARVFNDFESAKRLLLLGLLEQFYMPLRDVIEASGILHICMVEPKRARRWLRDLKEYQPGDVQAALREHNITLQAYAAYGAFSHLTHPNVLGSVTVIRDLPTDASGARWREYHYGGYKNEPWMKLELRGLLVFFLLTLSETCAPAFAATRADVGGRPAAIGRFVDELQRLGFDIEGIATPSTESAEDRRLGELVKKRFRFDLSLFNMADINGEESI